MPLQRVLSIFILSFIATLTIGCGNSNNDNVELNQSFQNFDAPVRLSFLNVAQRAAGTIFAPIRVGILDHNGRIVTTDTRAVTIALANPAGAILSGTTTVNAVNGVATFTDLSVDRAGEFTFVASADGLIGAESNAFDITAGGPGQISFLVGPPPLPTGTTFDSSNSVAKNTNFANPIQVEVRDAQGNLVQNAVTVNIVVGADGTGTTTLSGNVANTVNGVATFPNLQVESGGGATVIAAATSAANAVVSDPFFVVGQLDGFLAVSGPVPLIFRANLFPTLNIPMAPLSSLPTHENPVRGLATLRNDNLTDNGSLVAVIDSTGGGNTEVLTLNPDTGAITGTPADITIGGNAFGDLLVTGLTVDPATRTVFAYIDDVRVAEGLYTLNPTTGVATFVGATGLPNTGEGLAFEPLAASKFLFTAGASTVNGLASIVPSTGVATELPGTAATVIGTFNDLANNPFDNNLYLLDNATNILQFNKTTGAVTTFLPGSGARAFTFFSVEPAPAP